MVGSSNAISRETCRKQTVDSSDRQNRELGPLQAEWSRPGWPHVDANPRERNIDFGEN